MAVPDSDSMANKVLHLPAYGLMANALPECFE